MTTLATPPDERAIRPVPDRELERRWRLARAGMKERGLDALVMRAAGYVKWFADTPAGGTHDSIVIFHADGLMTKIDHGARGGKRALNGEDPLNRGVGDVLFADAFPAVDYTSGYEVPLLHDLLKGRGYRSVGLLGAGQMPHAFVRGLEEALAGSIALSNASDYVDRLRACKSPDELPLIRETAAMQDAIFAKVIESIVPGMRDFEVTAKAQYEGHLRGSELGIFLTSSAPLGQRAVFRKRRAQGRTLRAGDHLTLLIENNGPAGYYCELARTIVLGKASAELLEATEAAKAAQANTLASIRAGRSPAEIFEAHNEFMQKHGLPIERRVYCHGQGYDLVERPLVRADETMSIEPNVCLALHPGWETPSMFVNLCENFLTTASGPPERLHRTELKVFELDF